MAERSGSSNFLAFVVGGLVVVVVVLFLAMGGLDRFAGGGGGDRDIDIEIQLPEAPSG